ncbi:mitochondrial, Transcription elongation factor [Lucilia cuprina]|nr:mitochondrial, Transcription elongation factor [Lucilia cuprina]
MLRNLIKQTTIKKFNKYYPLNNRNLHTTTQKFVKEELQSVESKHVNRINELLLKYNTEQQQKILKSINNYNLNDLLKYDISKARANKLLAYRMRNGLLKDLNDIFSIEGFGLKVADKFYQSLLQEPKTNEVDLGQTPKARTAPFITPSLEGEQRESIKSCVSVRIGVNSITWARLDVSGVDVNAPCLLTHWAHHEISEKKLHLNELIQRCLYVNHLIPAADCYLFENPQMAQASNNPGSVEQQNINIQKAQVTSIMGYEFLTARLFNHLVGTERVSSEETIINMMRTFYNTNEMKDIVTEEEDSKSELVEQPKELELNFAGRVQFPNELREMFSKSPRYFREFLGQTLLLNLTFVRLVLLQDPESIATVSRGVVNVEFWNKTKL